MLALEEDAFWDKGQGPRVNQIWTYLSVSSVAYLCFHFPI